MLVKETTNCSRPTSEPCGWFGELNPSHLSLILFPLPTNFYAEQVFWIVFFLLNLLLLAQALGKRRNGAKQMSHFLQVCSSSAVLITITGPASCGHGLSPEAFKPHSHCWATMQCAEPDYSGKGFRINEPQAEPNLCPPPPSFEILAGQSNHYRSPRTFSFQNTFFCVLL